MDDKLAVFRQRVQMADNFAVYCAGEFASLLVQYCSANGLADKIVNCVVTEKDQNTPASILGIPVIELKDLHKSEDILFVVAILSEKSKMAINSSLMTAGYRNIYLMSLEEYRAINGYLADFSVDIKSELKRLFSQNQQHYEKLAMLIQSMPLVADTHKQSFDKYKDINKGKTVVVCAPGPSLNRYSFNENYIHIGLNSLLFQDRIKLDYYFNQHIPSEYDFWGNGFDVHLEGRKKYLENYSKLKCVKFIGQLIGNTWNISPPYGEFSNNNYCTYYISDVETTYNFCADIRYSFLYGARSVIFPAMQFAFFTNPQRILLVGCDGYSDSGANYYSKEGDNYLNEVITVDRNKTLLSINDEMEKIYKDLRKFAVIRYPNTEVIMVNPVRYKGIFRETTTDDAGQIIV